MLLQKRILILVGLLTLPLLLSATIKLPKILADHMVVQRQRPLNIWGWADPGETVKVKFNGHQAQVKTSRDGKWKVTLPAMEHGGPYEMIISGKGNSITLKNVLIGDVWVGSGQSNMEWIMENTIDAEKAMTASANAKIRLFTVPKDMSFKPKPDLKGGTWLECTPQNVRTFSAVAYYFGKKLNEELDVPIGLINSSWGGTRVEPWISWDLMQNEEPFKNMNIADLERVAADNEKNQVKYLAAIKEDRGISEKWFSPEVSTSGWKQMDLPREWGSTEIGNADGIAWFRKEIDLPAGEYGEATLSLGPIDDEDVTFVNGTKVGSMTQYNKERIYTLEKGLLKPGKNVIVVKVVDNQGGGGLTGQAEQLYLDYGTGKMPLNGSWFWKSSALTTDFGIKDVGPNSFASHLYNAMIAPFIAYPIRGVIWYQGESNAGNAYRYQQLFPMLIQDWRKKWGYEFPFFWAQLANFMQPTQEPRESSWAELREAQRLTLNVPKTGQAVILDIGEADDIHPRNKRDVGLRLALNALAVEYGKNIVHSGPSYKSMQIDGNKIVLSFGNVGDGLEARNKYGYLSGFQIAGEDKKFHWAKAHIDGDRVIVYSDSVANPVAVRYAWSDNPDDANLYNKNGLPASSFKTDDWKWSTQ